MEEVNPLNPVDPAEESIQCSSCKNEAFTVHLHAEVCQESEQCKQKLCYGCLKEVAERQSTRCYAHCRGVVDVSQTRAIESDVEPTIKYKQKELVRYVDSNSIPGGNFAPTFVSVHPITGNVYITDRSVHKIHIFSAAVVYLGEFGNEGKGRGEFLDPRGIAVTEHDECIVADSRNKRIQIFKVLPEQPYLEYSHEFNDEGRFRMPIDVAYQNGHIFVADFSCIKKFDMNGQRQVFDSGTVLTELTCPEIKFLWGVAVAAKGRVLTVDEKIGVMFEFHEGKTRKACTFGVDPGHLNGPLGVAVDEDDFILVADKYSYRVQIFTPRCNLYHIIKLDEQPRDVQVLKDGTIAVATCMPYASTGKLLLF